MLLVNFNITYVFASITTRQKWKSNIWGVYKKN